MLANDGESQLLMAKTSKRWRKLANTSKCQLLMAKTLSKKQTGAEAPRFACAFIQLLTGWKSYASALERAFLPKACTRPRPQSGATMRADATSHEVKVP